MLVCNDKNFNVTYSSTEGGKDISGWTYSTSINTSGTNKLGVSAKGNDINIYINDQKVYSFIDTSIANYGDFGIAIDLHDTTPAKFAFDNVIVITP